MICQVLSLKRENRPVNHGLNPILEIKLVLVHHQSIQWQILYHHLLEQVHPDWILRPNIQTDQVRAFQFERPLHNNRKEMLLKQIQRIALYRHSRAL